MELKRFIPFYQTKKRKPSFDYATPGAKMVKKARRRKIGIKG